MKCYRINLEIDNKIIGREFPQIQSFTKGYDLQSPNTAYNLINNQKPNFIPNLNGLEIKNGVKVTDILSTSMLTGGYLISDRLYEILRLFRIPPHTNYEAIVYRKNKNEYFKYNYLHFHFESEKYIDFKNSIFMKVLQFDPKAPQQKIQILSKDQWFRELEILPVKYTYIVKKLYLLKPFYQDYDMFEPGFGIYDTFISEALFSKLFSEKVTGFKYTPLDLNPNIIEPLLFD